jgi:hypothetical protein
MQRKKGLASAIVEFGLAFDNFVLHLPMKESSLQLQTKNSQKLGLPVQLLNASPVSCKPLTESCTRHKDLSDIFFNNRRIDFTKHNTRIVKPALMLVEQLCIM